MAVDEIVSVSPAPPGPQWSEGVTVFLHRVPETGGAEGGFEATGMRGVPLGVSVIAFEDSAREALGRLLRALTAFVFSGKVTVEDTTELERLERHEVRV